MTARTRGSFLLYAVSFVSLAAAGILLAIAAITFLDETAVLWASVALSAVAVVTAVAGLLVPRR